MGTLMFFRSCRLKYHSTVASNTWRTLTGDGETALRLKPAYGMSGDGADVYSEVSLSVWERLIGSSSSCLDWRDPEVMSWKALASEAKAVIP